MWMPKMVWKDNRLYRWELALMAGAIIALSVALVGSWLGGEQQELADKVVRLHVLAASDSQEDQALKLKVRDRILEETEPLLEPGMSRDEAVEVLQSNLEQLASAGEAVVRAAGRTEPVRVSVEETYFPTRDYEEFALPAGNYTALRVMIGEGEGKNWWCVVFPPLCTASASERSATAMADGLDGEDMALITEESPGYVLKFKSIELWQTFLAWLRGE